MIKDILSNLIIDGVAVPSAYLNYEGHANTYIVYSRVDTDRSYSGDDRLLGQVDYYDFDIYSNKNYKTIETNLIELLEANDFIYMPSKNSADMYEKDTKLYHKSLCFGWLNQREETE